jgi:hypothetical protein
VTMATTSINFALSWLNWKKVCLSFCDYNYEKKNLNES